MIRFVRNAQGREGKETNENKYGTQLLSRHNIRQLVIRRECNSIVLLSASFTFPSFNARDVIREVANSHWT